MAHCAELDESNIVTRVLVVPDDVDAEQYCQELFGSKNWKKTSYNTLGGVHILGGVPFRKNYAGIGYAYDEARDAFIPPRPEDATGLDDDSCLWIVPAKPVEGMA